VAGVDFDLGPDRHRRLGAGWYRKKKQEPDRGSPIHFPPPSRDILGDACRPVKNAGALRT
jgi:hypothetical protein